MGENTRFEDVCEEEILSGVYAKEDWVPEDEGGLSDKEDWKPEDVCCLHSLI